MVLGQYSSSAQSQLLLIPFSPTLVVTCLANSSLRHMTVKHDLRFFAKGLAKTEQ